MTSTPSARPSSRTCPDGSRYLRPPSPVIRDGALSDQSSHRVDAGPDDAGARADEHRGGGHDAITDGRSPVVDFPRTLRRLRTSLLVVGALVLVGWLTAGFVADAGWSLRLLAELVGLGLLVSFAVEVVVVGGAAVRGLLDAGARGDRLASSDVSILPPQLRRRRR